MFALGLPGFCSFLYVVRVLQAMQRTRVAFCLYLVENGINVVLAIVLVGPLGVRGLALSLSVAYTVGALAGLVVLRRWFGPPGHPADLGPAAPGGGWPRWPWGSAVLVVSNLSGATSGVGPGCGARWWASRGRPALLATAGARCVAARAAARVPGTGTDAARPPWQTPRMPGVRIVTDSACDLTDDLVAQHRRHRGAPDHPLRRRGAGGPPRAHARRVLGAAARAGALPETAAPSPGAFQAAYQQAADEGADAVLCLTISAGSRPPTSRPHGGRLLRRHPGPGRRHPLAHHGPGAAGHRRGRGGRGRGRAGELEAATLSRGGRIHVYGVLGGLDLLQRGGRIGGAQALLGSLLSIKPVVQVKDGVVAEESKQRTRSRALVPGRQGARPTPRWSAWPWPTAPATTSRTSRAQIERDRGGAPAARGPAGPGGGPHAGPGTVGVCYIVPGRRRPRPRPVPAGPPSNLGRGRTRASPTSWPTKAVDTVDTVVATVNDRAVRPAIVAARAVVFGVIIGVVAVTVLDPAVRRLHPAARRLPCRATGLGLVPGPRRPLLRRRPLRCTPGAASASAPR